MQIVFRILGFILMALLGYATVLGAFYLSFRMGLFTSLPDGFTTLYFGGGAWACIISIAVGAVGFALSGTAARIFFCIPFIVPASYAIGTLAFSL